MSEIIASGIIQKQTLQQWIDVFTPLVDEGKIHWGDDGLEVRCVEAGNVASILPGNLYSSGFESYESPGSVTQGVDFNRLEERISEAGSNDLIQLEMDMETRKLNIHFDNVDTSMGLIEPSSIRQEPDTPDLDLPNEVVVEGSDLERVVSVTEEVSDHVKLLGRDEDVFECFADGDLDDTTVTFDSDKRIDGNRLKECYSLFSHEYVKRLVDPIPANSEVTIQFGSEWPTVWEWSTADGAIEVTQLLAPRIQSD